LGIVDKVLGQKSDTWPKKHHVHKKDLVKAAGVGVARVRCHRDTWAFLEKYVPKSRAEDAYNSGLARDAFTPPGEDEITTEEDGMLTVPLSGTTLAAVLTWCQDIQFGTIRWNSMHKAIGRRVGIAISDALTQLVPSQDHQGPSAVIYLDDRIAEKQTPA
jgi:hypothetical protein